MWLSMAALVVGAVALLVLAGRPRHLVRAAVRWPALGVLAGLAAVVVDLVQPPGGATGRVAAAALGIVFLIANLHLRGAALAAAALLVGALPVLVDGAVVVPERVAVAIGRADDLGPARRVERPGDRLEALSAAVPLPVVDRAVRFADLVAAFGIIDAAAYALVVPRGRRVRVTPRHPSARYATVALATALDLEGAARPAPAVVAPRARAHRRAIPVGAP